MEHRRLMILFAGLSLFAFGVIVWYFLFSVPKPAPTLDETVTPFSLRDLPARIGFIFQDNPPETTTNTEITEIPRDPFVLVWNKPTTGNTFISKQVLREASATSTVGTSTVTTTKTIRATTTLLLFVDRITGYVYGNEIDTGKIYQISNTTLPGIYDAYIWANGTKIAYRYLDTDRQTIITMLATIPDVQPGGDPQPLDQMTLLPQGVSSMAVSASTNLLSYVLPNEQGSSLYTIQKNGITKLGDSTFSEWLLSYGGENLFATTKASAYAEGVTVSIPSFSQVVAARTGLVVKPAKDGSFLGSVWSRSGVQLIGINKDISVQSQVRTIASKCVATTGSYFICGVPKTTPRATEGLPDDWYQGRVLFDDTLTIVDGKTGSGYTLYEIDEKYGAMDMTNISITNSVDMVSFVRKQDGYLFLLNTNLLSDE